MSVEVVGLLECSCSRDAGSEAFGWASALSVRVLALLRRAQLGADDDNGVSWMPYICDGSYKHLLGGNAGKMDEQLADRARSKLQRSERKLNDAVDKQHANFFASLAKHKPALHAHAARRAKPSAYRLPHILNDVLAHSPAPALTNTPAHPADLALTRLNGTQNAAPNGATPEAAGPSSAAASSAPTRLHLLFADVPADHTEAAFFMQSLASAAPPPLPQHPVGRSAAAAAAGGDGACAAATAAHAAVQQVLADPKNHSALAGWRARGDALIWVNTAPHASGPADAGGQAAAAAAGATVGTGQGLGPGASGEGPDTPRGALARALEQLPRTRLLSLVDLVAMSAAQLWEMLAGVLPETSVPAADMAERCAELHDVWEALLNEQIAVQTRMLCANTAALLAPSSAGRPQQQDYDAYHSQRARTASRRTAPASQPGGNLADTSLGASPPNNKRKRSQAPAGDRTADKAAKLAARMAGGAPKPVRGKRGWQAAPRAKKGPLKNAKVELGRLALPPVEDAVHAGEVSSREQKTRAHAAPVPTPTAVYQRRVQLSAVMAETTSDPSDSPADIMAAFTTACDDLLAGYTERVEAVAAAVAQAAASKAAAASAATSADAARSADALPIERSASAQPGWGDSAALTAGPLARAPAAAASTTASDLALLPGLLPSQSLTGLDTAAILDSAGVLPDRALLQARGEPQSLADGTTARTDEGRPPSPTECLALWLLDKATAAVGTCLARLLLCKSADLHAAVPEADLGQLGLGSGGRQARESLFQEEVMDSDAPVASTSVTLSAALAVLVHALRTRMVDMRVTLEADLDNFIRRQTGLSPVTAEHKTALSRCVQALMVLGHVVTLFAVSQRLQVAEVREEIRELVGEELQITQQEGLHVVADPHPALLALLLAAHQLGKEWTFRFNKAEVAAFLQAVENCFLDDPAVLMHLHATAGTAVHVWERYQEQQAQRESLQLRQSSDGTAGAGAASQELKSGSFLWSSQPTTGCCPAALPGTGATSASAGGSHLQRSSMQLRPESAEGSYATSAPRCRLASADPKARSAAKQFRARQEVTRANETAAMARNRAGAGGASARLGRPLVQGGDGASQRRAVSSHLKRTALLSSKGKEMVQHNARMKGAHVGTNIRVNMAAAPLVAARPVKQQRRRRDRSSDAPEAVVPDTDEKAPPVVAEQLQCLGPNEARKRLDFDVSGFEQIFPSQAGRHPDSQLPAAAAVPQGTKFFMQPAARPLRSLAPPPMFTTAPAAPLQPPALPCPADCSPAHDSLSPRHAPSSLPFAADSSPLRLGESSPKRPHQRPRRGAAGFASPLALRRPLPQPGVPLARAPVHSGTLSKPSALSPAHLDAAAGSSHQAAAAVPDAPSALVSALVGARSTSADGGLEDDDSPLATRSLRPRRTITPQRTAEEPAARLVEVVTGEAGVCSKPALQPAARALRSATPAAGAGSPPAACPTPPAAAAGDDSGAGIAPAPQLVAAQPAAAQRVLFGVGMSASAALPRPAPAAAADAGASDEELAGRTSDEEDDPAAAVAADHALPPSCFEGTCCDPAMPGLQCAQSAGGGRAAAAAEPGSRGAPRAVAAASDDAVPADSAAGRMSQAAGALPAADGDRPLDHRSDAAQGSGLPASSGDDAALARRDAQAGPGQRSNESVCTQVDSQAPCAAASGEQAAPAACRSAQPSCGRRPAAGASPPPDAAPAGGCLSAHATPGVTTTEPTSAPEPACSPAASGPDPSVPGVSTPAAARTREHPAAAPVTAEHKCCTGTVTTTPPAARTSGPGEQLLVTPLQRAVNTDAHTRRTTGRARTPSARALARGLTSPPMGARAAGARTPPEQPVTARASPSPRGRWYHPGTTRPKRVPGSARTPAVFTPAYTPAAAPLSDACTAAARTGATPSALATAGACAGNAVSRSKAQAPEPSLEAGPQTRGQIAAQQPTPRSSQRARQLPITNIPISNESAAWRDLYYQQQHQAAVDTLVLTQQREINYIGRIQAITRPAAMGDDSKSRPSPANPAQPAGKPPGSASASRRQQKRPPAPPAHVPADRPRRQLHPNVTQGAISNERGAWYGASQAELQASKEARDVAAAFDAKPSCSARPQTPSRPAQPAVGIKGTASRPPIPIHPDDPPGRGPALPSTRRASRATAAHPSTAATPAAARVTPGSAPSTGAPLQAAKAYKETQSGASQAALQAAANSGPARARAGHTEATADEGAVPARGPGSSRCGAQASTDADKQDDAAVAAPSKAKTSARRQRARQAPSTPVHDPASPPSGWVQGDTPAAPEVQPSDIGMCGRTASASRFAGSPVGVLGNMGSRLSSAVASLSPGTRQTPGPPLTALGAALQGHGSTPATSAAPRRASAAAADSVSGADLAAEVEGSAALGSLGAEVSVPAGARSTRSATAAGAAKTVAKAGKRKRVGAAAGRASTAQRTASARDAPTAAEHVKQPAAAGAAAGAAADASDPGSTGADAHAAGSAAGGTAPQTPTAKGSDMDVCPAADAATCEEPGDAAAHLCASASGAGQAAHGPAVVSATGVSSAGEGPARPSEAAAVAPSAGAASDAPVPPAGQAIKQEACAGDSGGHVVDIEAAEQLAATRKEVADLLERLDISEGDDVGHPFHLVVIYLEPFLAAAALQKDWQFGAYPLASWLCAQPFPVQRECFEKLAAALQPAVSAEEGAALGSHAAVDSASRAAAQVLVQLRRKKIPCKAVPVIEFADDAALAKEALRVRRLLAPTAGTTGPMQLSAKLPKALQAVMMYTYSLLKADERWANGWVPFGLWLQSCDHDEKVLHVADLSQALGDSTEAPTTAREALAEKVVELFETYT